MSIFDLVNRFDPKTVNEKKNEWRRINYDFGISLGYPKCCVDQFCDEPPIVLNNRKIRRIDNIRYNVSHIDGVFTGFVPCDKCAKEIYDGKKTLIELISNRIASNAPFPNEWEGDKTDLTKY